MSLENTRAMALTMDRHRCTNGTPDCTASVPRMATTGRSGERAAYRRARRSTARHRHDHDRPRR